MKLIRKDEYAEDYMLRGGFKATTQLNRWYTIYNNGKGIDVHVSYSKFVVFRIYV